MLDNILRTENLNIKFIALPKNCNLTINYAFIEIEFGKIMIGVVNTVKERCEAICLLYFVLLNEKETLQEAAQRWPQSKLLANEGVINQLLCKHFCSNSKNCNVEPLFLAVRGTAFQRAVLYALVQLPFGWTRTYAEIAKMAQRPKAIRAAASAVAQNEIALLIPCHRVLSQNGEIKYHWGRQLKMKLIRYEVKKRVGA